MKVLNHVLFDIIQKNKWQIALRSLIAYMISETIVDLSENQKNSFHIAIVKIDSDKFALDITV